MAAAESEYDCSVAIARGNISQMVSNVSVIRRLQVTSKRFRAVQRRCDALLLQTMLGTAKDTQEHRSRLHLSIEQVRAAGGGGGGGCI
jgi:hypothetical protein